MWKPEAARRLMDEKGLKTSWLAEQCGIGVTSLRNILRGSKPSLPVIKLMAQALGCRESDLIEPDKNELRRA